MNLAASVPIDDDDVGFEGDYNMDDFGDEVETDAVHPRLANHGGRKPNKTTESCTYQCYDCGLLFQSLTQLLYHSPWHGSERCLKCSEPITVYIQTKSSATGTSKSSSIKKKTIRLHTCRRKQLRHQNSDLHYLADHIAQSLDWLHDKDPSVILCQVCSSSPSKTVDSSPAVFKQTPQGVESYLLHSNAELHNISGYCRKCTMPEFKIITSSSVCCTTHICTKDFQPVLKIIHD